MGCASASIRQGRNEAPGGASSRHAALRHEVARARKNTTPNIKALVHLIRGADFLPMDIRKGALGQYLVHAPLNQIGCRIHLGGM